jgi:hypothetical protein
MAFQNGEALLRTELTIFNILSNLSYHLLSKDKIEITGSVKNPFKE